MREDILFIFKNPLPKSQKRQVVISVRVAKVVAIHNHLLTLLIGNFANHVKKQNKKQQNAKSIYEKLKTKSLMFFVLFFLCDLQDFKFQYVNSKVFGASFLY